MKRSFSRGQTLVLMAISLLLLTLMVTLTLSIGAKVREKMEVQAVADAAAYSNAAVTARVYNEIALLSRAQIAHMVSMAGVQSLISWSSMYRAHTAAAFLNYGIISARHAADAARCCKVFTTCPHLCICSGLAAAVAGYKAIIVGIQDFNDAARFRVLDVAAARQSRMLQQAAMRLYAVQLVEYLALLSKINNQRLAQEMADDAKAGSAVPGEWDAPGGGDTVANREVGIMGATTPLDIWNAHHVYAGMGSRGFTFLTGRSIMDPSTLILQRQLQTQVVRAPDRITVFNQGSSYFSTLPEHGSLLSLANGKFSWTDDHGFSTLSYNHTFFPCRRYSMTLPTVAWLSAAPASEPQFDQHYWFPTFLFDYGAPPIAHSLGPCVACPNMWPAFVDYNAVRLVDEGDNFGQPKNYAVIQRDYQRRVDSGRPVDPWNLAFRFRFNPSSNASFDNRALALADGTDISKQTGLSAGIAYYHRKGHWKEPPNLLNPYWRATLVPLTVDDGSEGDVASTLGGVSAGWAGDAFRALRAQGYEGGP